MTDSKAVEPVRIPVPVETPVQVFAVVNRGYERRQVDHYLAQLEQEVAELRWEQEFLASREEALRKRDEELRRREALIADWKPTWDGLGDQAQRIMSETHEHARVLREQTARECGELRQRTQQDCAELRRTAESEADTLRRSAHRTLAVARSDAERMRTLLDRDLVRKRREADAEGIGIVNRARVAAEELLAAAKRAADRIAEQANEEVARLDQERVTAAQGLAGLAQHLHAFAAELVLDRAERETAALPPAAADESPTTPADDASSPGWARPAVDGGDEQDAPAGHEGEAAPPHDHERRHVL